MPLPPDTTGISIELEWFKLLANKEEIEPDIITITENPDPIENIKIIVVRRGVLFPLRYLKSIKTKPPDIIHFEYILGLYGTSGKQSWRSLQSQNLDIVYF